MHVKLKKWKKHIKINVHGQDVLCNMHCKQSKKHHARYMLKSVNTQMQKASNEEY